MARRSIPIEEKIEAQKEILRFLAGKEVCDE